MGCLCRRGRLHSAAVELGINDVAIGLDFGAFAVEDTHGLSEVEKLVGVENCLTRPTSFDGALY